MNFFDYDKFTKMPDLKKGWEESIIEPNDLNLNDDIKRYEDFIQDSFKDNKNVKVIRNFVYDEYLGTFSIKYQVAHVSKKE